MHIYFWFCNRFRDEDWDFPLVEVHVVIPCFHFVLDHWIPFYYLLSELRAMSSRHMPMYCSWGPFKMVHSPLKRSETKSSGHSCHPPLSTSVLVLAPDPIVPSTPTELSDCGYSGQLSYAKKCGLGCTSNEMWARLTLGWVENDNQLKSATGKHALSFSSR